MRTCFLLKKEDLLSEDDGGMDSSVPGAVIGDGGHFDITQNAVGQPADNKIFGNVFVRQDGKLIKKKIRNFVPKRIRRKKKKTNESFDFIKSIISESSFNINQLISRNDGSLSSSDVHSHIAKAEDMDEINTIGFGIETDDDGIVKVFVAEPDADEFERALSKELGSEEDIEGILNTLAIKYDIVDVEWPEEKTAESSDGATTDDKVKPEDKLYTDGSESLNSNVEKIDSDPKFKLPKKDNDRYNFIKSLFGEGISSTSTVINESAEIDIHEEISTIITHLGKFTSLDISESVDLKLTDDACAKIREFGKFVKEMFVNLEDEAAEKSLGQNDLQQIDNTPTEKTEVPDDTGSADEPDLSLPDEWDVSSNLGVLTLVNPSFEDGEEILFSGENYEKLTSSIKSGVEMFDAISNADNTYIFTKSGDAYSIKKKDDDKTSNIPIAKFEIA